MNMFIHSSLRRGCLDQLIVKFSQCLPNQQPAFHGRSSGGNIEKQPVAFIHFLRSAGDYLPAAYPIYLDMYMITLSGR